MAYNDSCCPETCPARLCDFCENEGNQTERPQSVFRPRGALARAIYSKQLMDGQLERMDHSKVCIPSHYLHLGQLNLY